MAKYGAVQFSLSPLDSQDVFALQVRINEDELAPKGRELNPHVTCRWGFHPEVTAADVSKLTKGTGDVDVTLGDFHAFPENHEGEPLVILLDSPALVKLHDALAPLPHTDPHPKFVPHLTIGYFKKGIAQKYAQAANPLKGKVMTLRDLQFRSTEKTFADVEKVSSPTTLQKPYAEDGHDAPPYVHGGAKRRRQWAHVFNSEWEKHKDDPKEERERIAFSAANSVAGSHKKFAKALAKANADDADEFTNRLVAALEAEWLALPTQVRSSLESAALSGAGHGLLQIDVSNAKLIASSNQAAQEYAVDRAAEMVGKKYDNEGNLVDNPNAKWTISSTTRDKIRDIVADSFTADTPLREIEDEIQQALADEAEGNGIFSQGRAKTIARTEVMRSQTGANFMVWRESGVVRKIKWLTAEDEKVCSVCARNDGAIVRIGQRFPSGHVMPGDPHPLDRCVLVVEEVTS